jgi:type I restriction enzyme S subunit
MAQTIYREWFVHFRFPGHEQVAMVETELGLIPEGWQRVALGQIAEINARSMRGSDSPGTIHYVDISSVSTGQIDTITDIRFDQAPGRARRILRHGDTIWSCVRPNRKSYSLIISPADNMIASTGFAVISPVSVPYTFLYQAVTTDEFVAYLTNHARGAAYPAVTAEDFEHAAVQLPDPGLTHQYHATVEPMFQLKHSLQRRNNTLRQTRDLLLPKLVSGEVKVGQARLS